MSEYTREKCIDACRRTAAVLRSSTACNYAPITKLLRAAAAMLEQDGKSPERVVPAGADWPVVEADTTLYRVRVRTRDGCVCSDAQIRHLTENLEDNSTPPVAIGYMVGWPVFVGQFWVPVLWDGEDDPCMCKLGCIEVVRHHDSEARP